MPYGKALLDTIESSGNLNISSVNVAISNNLVVTGTVFSNTVPLFGPKFGRHQLFTASGTFTAQVTGLHTITLVGAGGSGAATRAGRYATGGGAGALVVKVLSLVAGNTYTVTIGAGGTAVTQTTTGATAGNAGGNTSFSGTGITTLTALRVLS